MTEYTAQSLHNLNYEAQECVRQFVRLHDHECHPAIDRPKQGEFNIIMLPLQ